MCRPLVVATFLSVAICWHAALAQEAEPPLPSEAITAADVAWFFGGAAAAFLSHEASHVLVNLALGNTPHLSGTSTLGIPFFAIEPRITCNHGRCTKYDGSRFSAGPPGVFAIVAAGFTCQHVTDEIILTQEPALRFTAAPFRKGMLAFNTLTSIGYVFVNLAGVESPNGDLGGLESRASVPRGVLAALLLAPALLDLTRYYFPNLDVVPWVSRWMKTSLVGVTFTL